MEVEELEDEFQKFLKAWATIIASLCYSYFISSKLTKGILRFLSLLPVFSLYLLLPFSLHSSLLSGFLSGFISFLANFKLILFAFNLGPLSSQNTFLDFILFASLPIKIKSASVRVRLLPCGSGKHSESCCCGTVKSKQNWDTPKRGLLTLTLKLGLKTLICGVLLFVYQKLGRNLVVFCCWMYLFNDVALGLCATLVGCILGVELEPPSDEPYVATSLQDFWGNRWNRMISDALRHTVYKPVRSIVANFIGPGRAAGPALLATFVVSGLMHEMVFYHVTRVRPTWEVTWFFVLHGVCLVLEVVMKRRVVLGRKARLHWAISGPLTVGFVVISGHWLFFPQVMRNNIDIAVMEDVVVIANYFKEKLCFII